MLSVIMPAYNAGPFIEEAIESVLAQSYRNFELLILDDGSTDNTLEIARRFEGGRVRVFARKNDGKSSGVNFLTQEAKGEYVVMLDADDISTPDRLKKIAQAFSENSSARIVFSGFGLILEQQRCAPRRIGLSVGDCRELVEEGKMPSHDPTMAFRRELISDYQFDRELVIGEGLDFVLRVGEKYDLVVIPDILYFYRIHSNSITKRLSQKKAEAILAVTNKARTRRKMPLKTLQEVESELAHYVHDDLNNLSGHFVDASYLSVSVGRRIEALSTALVSLKVFFKTKDIRYLKPLAYALSPKILNFYYRKHHSNA